MVGSYEAIGTEFPAFMPNLMAFALSGVRRMHAGPAGYLSSQIDKSRREVVFQTCAFAESVASVLDVFRSGNKQTMDEVREGMLMGLLLLREPGQ